MNKLVSVVIPSYGGGEFLQKAVDSVLAQTYPYLEVIVVDDNGIGTENQARTAKKINRYQNNERFTYLCHDANKNGSAARNTGVRAAKGEFIALLDDDDIYLPDNLEKHMQAWESLSNEYALSYCSREMYCGEKFVEKNHVTKSGSLLYEILMHKVTIGSSSLVIRKTVWDELGGFDESFRRHQDWEFTARVAAKYKVFACDHIGFRRYLEFRNSAKSVETVIQYREHYLEKIMPLIRTLTPKQQKDVIIHNRMDAAIQYLKRRNLSGFLKEWNRIKPGFRGFGYLFHVMSTKVRKGMIHAECRANS